MNEEPRSESNRYSWIESRSWLAFVLAPLPVPLIVALAVLLLPAVPLTRVAPQPPAVRVAEAVFFGLVALPVAYLLEAVLGLPIYVRYLRPRRLNTFATCVALGIVVGGASPWLAAFLLILWQGSTTDVPAAVIIYASGIGATCGLISGGIFAKLGCAGTQRRGRAGIVPSSPSRVRRH